MEGLELPSPSRSFSPIFIAVLLFVVLPVISSRRRQQENLPPSPPNNFLIGHALRLPADYQWRTFAQWGREYGEML